MNQGRCNVLKSNKTAPHAPSRDERPDEEVWLDDVLLQQEPGAVHAVRPEHGEEAGVGQPRPRPCAAQSGTGPPSQPSAAGSTSTRDHY